MFWWEAYETIERFAREGHAAILPEWGTYFRWWGIYSQGDGPVVGVIGEVVGLAERLAWFRQRRRIA